MDRRLFMAGVAGGLGAGALSGPAGARPAEARVAGARPAPAGAHDGDWVGARVLAGGKGYAPCPLGQLHYRDLGPRGRTPFLLIHQSPISMAEFAEVQSFIAAAGRRSIAVDNPGYGLSDPPPAGVTVEQLADNLVALLDHLAVRTVIVAGHHTGAAIAGCFAARHPGRVTAVVLHGAPLYSAEERALRLARPAADLQLRPDGSHLSDLYRLIYGVMGPDRRPLAPATWATLGAVLAGPEPAAYRAVFAHDLQPDLQAIRAPTLLLSDGSDMLAANDRRVAALRPDFDVQLFSSGGSPALMQDPAGWAAAVLHFASRRGV